MSGKLKTRWNYYRRVFAAYLTPGQSQLTFWHETPEVNDRLRTDELGEYYMSFHAKADYPGAYDSEGIPLLDYRGAIGAQYNPIAIAQYGLGNYNLWQELGSLERRARFLRAADWHVSSLEENRAGCFVWNHHFDWDYRTRLEAPWYSGLAQGQGISLLVRAHRATGKSGYLDDATRAFESFFKSTDEGGVTYRDDRGDVWIEEYIVSPPTHILNGFIWALWGVYDYLLATRDARARELFDDCVRTLRANLHRYDVGFWSLYEQSGTRLEMVSSPFYHRLHVVQLHVLGRITGDDLFTTYARRWEAHLHDRLDRSRALIHKAAFKLFYY